MRLPLAGGCDAAALGAMVRCMETETGSRRRPGFWLVGRFTPRQVDWMVLAAAVALWVPELVKVAPEGRWLPVAVALLPFSTVPLLWRRTRPGLMLAVLGAAFIVLAVFGPREPDDPSLVFGVYAAALYGNRPTRLVAAAAGAAVLVVAFGIVLATGSTTALGHLAAPAFGFGVAWVLGDRTRNRRAYLAELEERAARLQRERAEHARRAAEAERIGIARELHDVVVHNVSVIAVQAGAARATSHGDADRATAALGLIERTARATLTELRALLGVLRRQDQDDRSGPVLAPQPSLAHLDRLLAQAREAGVHVDARVEGVARPLPATVDLAAYRIVQEALTNAARHAPGASVVLTVRYGPGHLQVVVADDGPGMPPPSAGPGGGIQGGVGLIGMRERAALVGGELRAGPAAGGGFRVEARLPIDAATIDAASLAASPGAPAPSVQPHTS